MDTFCVLASTLSRASALSHETLPVTRIYHNISYQHHLRGYQGVSAACGPFPAPFPGHIVKKRPDNFCASAWLCSENSSPKINACRCWKRPLLAQSGSFNLN